MTRWGRYLVSMRCDNGKHIGKHSAIVKANDAEPIKGSVDLAKNVELADTEIAPVYFAKAGKARLAVKLPGHARDITMIILEPTSEGEWPVQTNDTFVLSAKDAVIRGVTLRYEPNPKKLCAGFWTNPKDKLEWLARVTKPGRYEVTLFQGCGKGQGGSDVNVHIADQTLAFTVLETGHFQKFVPVELGEVTLDKAAQIIVTIAPVNKKAKAIMDVQKLVLERVGD